jgi:2-C-methyl-D-erythritol 4-phosphate cytidylyltransferase
VAVRSVVGAILPLPIAIADNRPAAFTPVAGQVLLVRILRTLFGAVPEQATVVAAAEPLVDDVRECIAAHGLSVGVVASAGTRAQCLTAALEYFERESISPQRVLIHDVRRPLTSAGMCERVVAELRSGSDVVMPMLAMTDSVKAVDAAGSVTRTLDRSALRSVQFPRGFATDQLARLLAQFTSDEFDELEETVRAGVPIAVVDGEADAFVADLPRDTAFVEAVIACRPTGHS